MEMNSYRRMDWWWWWCGSVLPAQLGRIAHECLSLLIRRRRRFPHSTLDTIGDDDDFVCTLEEEVERKEERMINAPTDLTRQLETVLTAHIFCGRLGLSQTDTHDKHTSCFSQQLLHIRDHNHTTNQSRNVICTRLGGFSSSRFFSRVISSGESFKLQKAFIYIR